MRFRIGLDIGVASVGWSVIKLDENGNPYRIEDLGVRVFLAAENPKDGESLALPRRMARGARRRIRRRAYRLKRIDQLFEQAGLLTKEQIENIYLKEELTSVWYIRAKAIKSPISNEDLYRAVRHICKRRGFKSNRKAESKADKEGALLKGVSEISRYLKEKQYETIGEMFYYDEMFQNRKRNSDNDYSHTVARIELEHELRLILTRQKAFGNQLLTDQVIEKIIEIFNSQRPFATKDMIEKMVGYCTFEKSEKRAPKKSYTYEYSMLLQKVNSLRIKSAGQYRGLTDAERKMVIDLAHQKTVKYLDLRKVLNLAEEDRFKGLTYSDNQLKDTEKAVFVDLKGYLSLKKRFADKDALELFEQLTDVELDEIAIALTFYKTDEDIIAYLQEKSIAQNIIEIVLDESFEQVGHLSLKALRKINPYLEKGLTYDKACEMAGYDFRALNHDTEKQKFLPPIPVDEITSPVVRRSLTQCRKVINAIIRKYGQPESIHIELAREMSHDFSERRKMQKEMLENQRINEEAIKKLSKEFNLSFPRGQDIVKLKLWREQNGKCVYSDQDIDPTRLYEPGYVDVDHIIPYSRSFDDSYSNKVLVLGSENRQKGNRLPYEYFGMDQKKWHEFEERVRSMHFRSHKKVVNLLRKDFNLDDQREFMNRNINDTRYATRYLMNFIREHLEFSNLGEYKQKVFSVNGPVTAFLRKRWGLTKVREENDRHHALDATVVALTSPSMIRLVTAFAKYNESRNKDSSTLIDPFTGEVFDISEFNEALLERFPYPWPTFRTELEIRLNSDNPAEEIKNCKLENYRDCNFKNVRPLFVSRMPIRKFSGQAHEDTIRSAKLFEQGYVYKKTALADIKFDENGDFDMVGKEHDPYTYNAIKQRYLQYRDAKQAFKEPLFKPKSNGEPGPIIKKVKIKEKSNVGVFVHNGIASNGPMVRIDIFKKEGKFYIIPIYVADLIKKELPNLAIKNGVSRSEWTVVDDSFEFLFSLQQNDLVKLTFNDKVVLGYYRKCPGNQTQIYIDQHDVNDARDSKKYGITTALNIEKYVVDPLGNYYPVKKERRRGLA